MKISTVKVVLLFLLAFFLVLPPTAYSQSDSANRSIRDSLNKLSSLIWKQKTDSGRLAANDFFYKKFHIALEMQNPSPNLLDSIKGITLATSDDKKMRIFSWNIPLSDGSNSYFGFIQFTSNSTEVIPLKSAKVPIGDFSHLQLPPPLWYGAIYYKIIQVQISGKQVYTLLGWDGYTPTSNRKIIDILSLSDSGGFVFGLPVFKTGTGLKSRVVIEYAEKANMILRYDYQAINVQKRKKIVKQDSWLIVMDRLIPMEPQMNGIRKYYVPAGDTYDGYIFKNGFWVLAEDIEVVNRETRKE
jgi:hypothetical protein